MKMKMLKMVSAVFGMTSFTGGCGIAARIVLSMPGSIDQD
jgi:hypothetical protein